MNDSTTYDQHPSDRDHGPTVLIVDDEEVCQKRLKRLCQSSKNGNASRILLASNLSEARALLSTTPIQVLLLDKNLDWTESGASQNGIENISLFLELQPHLQILVVTSSEDIQDCVKAMRYGAFGYITKGNPDEAITQQINKALEVASLVMERIRRDRGEESVSTVCDFPGSSRAITLLRSKINAVSETNKPVLLLGETGTGKTTAARYIHSRRKQYLKQKDRPFFSVNIAALSPELVERELFGNEKGAYTDAKEARPGFFELANNGTLFLDEIGEASLDLQSKLLKTIEEGIFFRVGGQQERRSNFKLICATNRNLEELVSSGQFREDLYMRISTFVVTVPSLLERADDIPDILRSLLAKCCADNNVHIAYEDLPSEFIEYLTETPPRGNIRGLEQQMSRLLVFSPKDKKGVPNLSGWKNIPGLLGKRNAATLLRDPITYKEFMNRPFDMIGSDFQGFKVIMDLFLKKLVQDALQKYPRQRDAAERLQMPRSTLADHLRRLQLPASHEFSRRPKKLKASGESIRAVGGLS